MEQDVYGQTATTKACTLSYNKDFDIDYDLFIIIKELLNEFPPTFDSMANLYHLPFSKEFVVDVINEWYFTGEQVNSNKWNITIYESPRCKQETTIH